MMLLQIISLMPSPSRSTARAGSRGSEKLWVCRIPRRQSRRIKSPVIVPTKMLGCPSLVKSSRMTPIPLFKASGSLMVSFRRSTCIVLKLYNRSRADFCGSAAPELEIMSNRFPSGVAMGKVCTKENRPDNSSTYVSWSFSSKTNK